MGVGESEGEGVGDIGGVSIGVSECTGVWESVC